MDVGMLILRLVVGALFIGHGTQKLFGWFQGHGLEGTAGFMESLGYRPGKRYAALGGLAEAGGGTLLVLGLLTPLAAALIVGMMLNAILAVHLENGVWSMNGGYEFPLVMAAAAAAIALAGAGGLSMDNLLGLSRLSGVWGLLGIVLGLLIGAGANSARKTAEEIEAGEDKESRRAA